MRRTDSGMLGTQPRRHALAVAVNLYRGDTTFRWFVDLALIGGVILAFLHGQGLRFPELPAFIKEQKAKVEFTVGGNPCNAPGVKCKPLTPIQTVPYFGPPMTGFDAEPTQIEPGLPPPRKSGIDRALFASSSPATQAKLNVAADAYENRNAAGAVLALHDADMDDVNVITVLGMATISQFGQGNLIEGQRLLSIAAERDHRQAQTFLGYLLITGPFGIKRESERGRALLEKASDAGDVTAAVVLLHAYQVGWGGIVDKTRARTYLLRAADLGDPRAAFAVARAHLTGRGLPKDEAAAMRFGLVAAQGGNHEGQALVGSIHVNNFIAGATNDLAPAVEWLERATRGKDPLAMALLAGVYLSVGKGTPWHDPAKGADTLRRCAEAVWHGGCFYAYAGVLQDGIGTPKNLVAAYAYNSAALEAGTTEAKDRLAALERMLTPMELDEAHEQARVILRRKPVMAQRFR